MCSVAYRAKHSRSCTLREAGSIPVGHSKIWVALATPQGTWTKLVPCFLFYTHLQLLSASEHFLHFTWTIHLSLHSLKCRGLYAAVVYPHFGHLNPSPSPWHLLQCLDDRCLAILKGIFKLYQRIIKNRQNFCPPS